MRSNSNSSVYVLKKKHCLFLLKHVHTMRSASYVLLYYYAETKQMIYESVNLKGVLYKPKQNCISLQRIITCTDFANIGLIFCVHCISLQRIITCTDFANIGLIFCVHSLSSEQAFNKLNKKSCSEFSELIFTVQ